MFDDEHRGDHPQPAHPRLGPGPADHDDGIPGFVLTRAVDNSPPEHVGSEQVRIDEAGGHLLSRVRRSTA